MSMSLHQKDITPSTLVVYGAPHSGKTTQIAQFAVYQYMKTGFPVRLLHLDSGGCEHLSEFINAGFIELFAPRGAQYSILSLVRAVGRGCWLPTQMLPLVDPQGKPIMDNGKVVMRECLTHPSQPARPTANDLSKVGGYVIEGVSTIAWMALHDLSTRDVGSQEKSPEVSRISEIGFDPQVAEEQYGAPSRGHYGAVQNAVLNLMRMFAGLPVPRIMWTGHEGKGKDPDTGQPIRGVGLVGSAATAQFLREVGDVLHIQPLQVQVMGVDGKPQLVEKRVMWFIPHLDDQTAAIQWPATSRIAVSGGVESAAAHLYNTFPYGFVELDPGWGPTSPDALARPGLFSYLAKKDEAIQLRTRNLLELRAGIDQWRQASLGAGGGQTPGILMASVATPAVPAANAAAQLHTAPVLSAGSVQLPEGVQLIGTGVEVASPAASPVQAAAPDAPPVAGGG